MRAQRVTDDFFAGPQPTVEELGQLKAKGFKSLMVNRPEGEDAGQPSFADEEQAAVAQGLGFSAVPLVPGQLTAELVRQFAQEYERLPKPVFAHCRAGTRSVMLWAMTQRGKMSADDIISTAATAGFDIAQLRPHLGA